jgi:hypothetical protein
VTQYQIKPDEGNCAIIKGYQINECNKIKVSVSQPTYTENIQAKTLVFSKRLQISNPDNAHPCKQKKIAYCSMFNRQKTNH